MSVNYGKFELPTEIDLDESTATVTYGRFVAEPFERGFGHTIGSSLRRMMLSSLEAPAIISVRLEGVPHEYMAIEGITEDMINIVLNFKGALLRRLPTDSMENPRESRIVTSTLEVTQEELDKNGGSRRITLGDILSEGYFEIVNPDLYLFTVTMPMRKQVDLRVLIGRGYVPSERHVVRDKTSDEILIDSAFSPVRLVNYFVENTRVGQDTDLDRLILEVHTDGRVTPEEAINFAAQIGQRHFDVFNKVKGHAISFDQSLLENRSDQDEMIDKLILRIDEIELSVRSTNCLSGANIDTIAELVSIPERRMLEFRNFGKKSLNEIKAKLEEMGLGLGMDLSPYGITLDNVKDKIRHYQEQRRGKREQRPKDSTKAQNAADIDDDLLDDDDEE